MSGKIYKKNLTFLQDQPFAENLLSDFSYKKRKVQILSKRNSPPSLSSQNLRALSPSSPMRLGKKLVQVGIPAFSSNQIRNKSERMKKSEANLIKHFCLTLERAVDVDARESKPTLDSSFVLNQRVSSIPPSERFLNPHLRRESTVPHLLVSTESMRNTLLSTRTSRSSERVKAPSQFKKILRECRKIRLLYGNLSKRQLARATSKICVPGENLLIWLESRLDVVLERCGFFVSIKAARQSVLNGKVTVNSKVVKSPGFLLEGGDLIKIIQERLLVDSGSSDFRFSQNQVLQSLLPLSGVRPREALDLKNILKEEKNIVQSKSESKISRKDQGYLLRFLFSDFLLYSLFVKRESLCVELKTQLNTRQLLSSWTPPANNPFNSEQPRFRSPIFSLLKEVKVTTDTNIPLSHQRWDLVRSREIVRSNLNLGVTESNSAVKASKNPSPNLYSSETRVFAANSNTPSWKKEDKKNHTKVQPAARGLDLSQSKRTKPLHLEISFPSLCVVYLYPPQRICLPVMIDVDSLAKAF
jgi:ribosomal protein S4